jgi:hypothetical protein
MTETIAALEALHVPDLTPGATIAAALQFDREDA